MTHPFEKAGLGKAPFRFAGMEYKVGPIRQVLPDGLVFETGSPGQPMSSCDYCAQGIALECWIVSSDKKRFKVGCDCVRKVCEETEPRLVKAVDVARKKHEKKLREARALRVRESLEQILASEESRTALRAQPHPTHPRGLTLLDWAEWMLKNAGASGRAKVAKAIYPHVTRAD